MILVDTSVWVAHLKHADAGLVDLLARQNIASHPFVVGELALGGAFRGLIEDLRDMPQLMTATDEEVLSLIDRHGLVGQGIGYVDAHLLASTLLAGDAKLWTLDRSLESVARRLDVARIALN